MPKKSERARRQGRADAKANANAAVPRGKYGLSRLQFANEGRAIDVEGGIARPSSQQRQVRPPRRA